MRNTDAIKPQLIDDPTGRIYYRRLDLFHEALGTVILLLVVFCMFCAVFWLSTHYAKPIQGSSMQPNINNYAEATGDIAIVSSTARFTYNDIIIVDMERSNNTDSMVQGKLLIKRAIAFGGDSLKLVRDDATATYHFELKKRGESEFAVLEETFAYPMTEANKANAFFTQINWTIKPESASDNSITIPEGYMFFVGDNRDVSYDCRTFGPVETSACIGVVETVLKTDNFWNRLFSVISSIFNIKHTEAIKG